MARWLINSIATDGSALFVVDAVARATLLLCLATASRRDPASVGGGNTASALGPDALRLDCAPVPVLVAPRLANRDLARDNGVAWPTAVVDTRR